MFVLMEIYNRKKTLKNTESPTIRMVVFSFKTFKTTINRSNNM